LIQLRITISAVVWNEQGIIDQGRALNVPKILGHKCPSSRFTAGIGYFFLVLEAGMVGTMAIFTGARLGRNQFPALKRVPSKLRTLG